MPDTTTNVMFKRGTHQALLNLKNNNQIIDGSFYLTTDTNRLFVGQANSTGAVELVELNKSIERVNSVQELQNLTDVYLGQFYYITGTNAHTDTSTGGNNGNILAVCTSIDDNGNATWTQVNPDTNENDDTRVSNLTVTKDSSASNGSQLVYNITLNQETSHNGGTWANNASLSKQGVLTISSEDITSIVTDVAVDVANSSVSNNQTTINTTGTGANQSGTGFTIKGSSRVQLSNDTSGNGIVIDTPDYEINSPAVASATAATSAAINLGVNNGSETAYGTITVKTGEDLAINNTQAGEFTIYHKDSAASAKANTLVGPSTDIEPAAGTTFNVPQVKIDAQGHVTALENRSVKMPVDKDTKVTAITANNAGQIVLTPSEGSDITSGETAVLYHDIDIYNADGTKDTTKSARKNNQSNLGAFYDKAAIDTLLKGLNAVTYKGTRASDLPTSNVHNGDAYLASADFTVGSGANAVSYHKGDLIIATGEETDGVLTNPTWQVISSGSDTDTTYDFGTNGTTITATPSPNGTAISVATFENGAELTATAGIATNSIKYNHNTSGVTPGSKGLNADTGNLSAGGTFKVPYVTVNSYGHVTGLDEHTVTLPNDSYSLVQNGSKLIFKNRESELTDVTWKSGSNVISVVGNATNKDITISHNTVTRSDTTPAVDATGTAIPDGGTFNVVSGVTSSNEGHVTGVTVTKYKLPQQVTYQLQTATTNNTKKIVLQAQGGTSSEIAINSSTLDIQTGGTTNAPTLAVDLVWGSF